MIHQFYFEVLETNIRNENVCLYKNVYMNICKNFIHDSPK